MSDDYAQDDAFCPDEPTCQHCGKICKRTEVVWTGDRNSYKGCGSYGATAKNVKRIHFILW